MKRRRATSLTRKGAAKEAPFTGKPVPAEIGLAAGAAEKTEPAETSEPLEAPAPALDLSREKTVTVKEAAYRLRKSEDAVHFWLRSGRLRGWQPGGRGCAILVAEASVTEALCCSLGGRANGARGRALA